MFKRNFFLLFIAAMMLFSSGCALIGAALAAGAAYGLSQAFGD